MKRKIKFESLFMESELKKLNNIPDFFSKPFKCRKCNHNTFIVFPMEIDYNLYLVTECPKCETVSILIKGTKEIDKIEKENRNLRVVMKNLIELFKKFESSEKIYEYLINKYEELDIKE